MNIKWLEKIKPDYQTTDNYQHGFHDAIQVVMDKLLSEQKENSAGVVNLSNVVSGQKVLLGKFISLIGKSAPLTWQFGIYLEEAEDWQDEAVKLIKEAEDFLSR
jgi:hypothetical protein